MPTDSSTESLVKVGKQVVQALQDLGHRLERIEGAIRNMDESYREFLIALADADKEDVEECGA